MKTTQSTNATNATNTTIGGSLAVKYRPNHLRDLVGQKHIYTQLRGMFRSKQIPAAFLLDGRTGCGKTTVARLIHRYLNCEKQNACGKCESCKLSANAHPDLINVNAGTDGKIDDIRKLIKGARVAPYFKKRLILIDEAHKLTGASAEALLIPLEEPSRDTVWVLCTTNPEKVLPTLVNRCLRFTVRDVEMDDMVSHLSKIVEKENSELSGEGLEDALRLVADFSNGSMRQALALLESVLYAAAGGADISTKDVLSSFVENSEVDLDKSAVSLVASLLNDDLKAAIRFIRLSQNTRGLLSKSRWLIDHLIGRQTKTAKYTPYSGRLFDALAQKKKIEISLDKLLRLQLCLVDTEMKMNTTSIDESVLLQTAIAGFAFANN